MAITIIQITISIVLIVLILLQERSSGIGGAFGGGSGGGFYQTRRGLEKLIFFGTIVAAVLFIALAIFSLLL